MRPNRARQVLLMGTAIFLLIVVHASAEPNDVGSQLKSVYDGKVLTLRHFYEGEDLHFGPDGELLDQGTTGPWTVDAQLIVKDVNLRDRAVIIQGNRVFFCFDSATNELRDVFAIHQVKKNSRLPCGLKHDSLKRLAQGRRVRIEIQLVSEAPDINEIALTIRSVFLEEGEPLQSAAPAFWRDWFAFRQGGPENPTSLDEPVYRVKAGEVSAPHPLYAPDPGYAEAARLAHYSAEVTLSLVVDRTGTPREIQIVKPAGLGLDEKLVEAVSKWKFEPGQKDASPVAVQLEVETSFSLY
jgi:TonB family protein